MASNQKAVALAAPGELKLNVYKSKHAIVESENSESEENENIPYHAREYARPFTYGNLPKGFKTSDLNHVAVEEEIELPKESRVQNVVIAASPTALRKSYRPSISPSRPVLRKTPTRQEFEEMLMERREQSLREQNLLIKQQAQNAAIQKDLDELQDKLSKEITRSDSVDFNNSIAAKSFHVKQLNTDSSNLLIEEIKRSDTPAFPVHKSCSEERCVSPYLSNAIEYPNSINNFNNNEKLENAENSPINKINPKQYPNDPHEVEPHLVKFAKDCSDFWYKPYISREDAISILRCTQPGTFLIRNSSTYKDAYGLVVRVAKPPPGVAITKLNGDELVRHFLLEPTTRGVCLKGCANEPVFTSLSAFVYQHSITALALPCKLIIPDQDLLRLSLNSDVIVAQKQVLSQGAACNVLYLFTCNTESLTGDEAVRKAVFEMYVQSKIAIPIEVHFKVCQQGITVTDNTRRVFFRRHYTANNISHVGIDPDGRYWSVTANDEGLQRKVNKTIFAFVARPMTGCRDNECHVFCDLAVTQPANAIVSFAKKVIFLVDQKNKMI